MTSKEQVVLRPDRYNKLIETFERLELAEAKGRMALEDANQRIEQLEEILHGKNTTDGKGGLGMNIHQAYVIYNNGIQSVDPQLAEAIDRIIDHKNMQLEKLDRTELAEAKARMEIEQLEIKVKNQAAQLIEYQKSFSKMKDQKWAVERMAYNRKQTIKQLRSLVGKLQKQLKTANRALAGESNE